MQSLKKSLSISKFQSIDSVSSPLSPRIHYNIKSTPSYLKSTSIMSSIASMYKISTENNLSYIKLTKSKADNNRKSGENLKNFSYKLDTAKLIVDRILQFIKKHFMI